MARLAVGHALAWVQVGNVPRSAVVMSQMSRPVCAHAADVDRPGKDRRVPDSRKG